MSITEGGEGMSAGAGNRASIFIHTQEAERIKNCSSGFSKGEVVEYVCACVRACACMRVCMPVIY